VHKHDLSNLHCEEKRLIHVSRKNGAVAIAVSVLAALIVVFGVLLQSRLDSAKAAHPFAIPARAMNHLQDSVGSEGATGETPSQTIDAQLYQERAYPNNVIAPNALINGLNQYTLMSEHTGGQNWHLAGPNYAPGTVYHDPYTGATLSGSGRLTAIKAVPSTCHAGGCDTIYVGTANGGVWKTTDGGQNWNPVFDNIMSTAIGSLVLDPVNPNIIYVGTGEPSRSGDSHRGAGIFRSTDAGAHWTPLGGFNQFVNRAVGDLVVDPRGAGNPSTTSLYAVTNSAAVGEAVTGGSGSAPYLPDRGFYYSNDGGQTWTQSNPTSINAPSVYSTFGLNNMPAATLQMDPSNPNILYAGFTSSGLYKSTNDGLTWTQLTTGMPGGTLFSADARYMVAIAPTNPLVIYVSYANPATGGGTIYKSINGGTSFSTLTTPNWCDSQCFYDMPIVVSPNDPNTVYAGGVESYNGYAFIGYHVCSAGLPLNKPYPNTSFCYTTIMKTTDGGATWYDIAENDKAGGVPFTGNGVLHPDAHAIFVNPTDPATLYQGSDGGIFKTQNATFVDPTWVSLNKGLATLQVQGMAVGPTGQIFFGTQDNGTFWLPTNSQTSSHINNGDGGLPMADPVNPNIAYTAFTGGTLYRDDNVMCIGCSAGDALYHDYGGDTSCTYTQIADWIDGAQFYAPHAVAPSNANVVFEGTNRIIRSLDKGGYNTGNVYSPSNINGDCNANDDPGDSTGGASTNGSIPGNWAPLSTSATFGGGNIAQIAISPVDPNYIAVATTHGRIYYATNALSNVNVVGNCDGRTTGGHTMQCTYTSGINWTRIDQMFVKTPNRYPSSLTFAPGSTNKVYATFSGFWAAGDAPATQAHVFVVTVNGGIPTWQNLDGTSPFTTLPNLPANSLVVNPNIPSHLYLAADVGTFFSPDGGAHWLRTDFGLPNTPVYQLLWEKTAGASGALLAATHGRAIWRGSAP
jgi:hypothetical protein